MKQIIHATNAVRNLLLRIHLCKHNIHHLGEPGLSRPQAKSNFYQQGQISQYVQG